MSIRPIIRDPLILDGRWHLEGTKIAVAAIQRDARLGRKELQQYALAGLTEAEIESALSFQFPVVRDLSAAVEFASLTVACVCGEDTHVASIVMSGMSVDCICGRIWQVRIMPEAVIGPRPDGRLRWD